MKKSIKTLTELQAKAVESGVSFSLTINPTFILVDIQTATLDNELSEYHSFKTSISISDSDEIKDKKVDAAVNFISTISK